MSGRKTHKIYDMNKTIKKLLLIFTDHCDTSKIIITKHTGTYAYQHKYS